MIRKISAKKVARGERYHLKKSPVKRSTKPIRKVNPKAKAKRKIAYRKMLRSKEYLAAKAEAMARSGNQCELWLSWVQHPAPLPPATRTTALNATTTHVWRCEATYDLHAHHKSYPKTRPLQASDLTICCKPHHEYLESLKPHKQHRRGF